MKIVNAYPPNYDAILLHVSPDKTTTFCYGDTIYNPHNVPITPDLEVHEEVHQKQQGKNPEIWWYRYLKDSDFRLSQELEAYGEQYAFVKRHVKEPKLLDWFKEQAAFALSGSVYGNLLSYGQAESKLRSYTRQVNN